MKRAIPEEAVGSAVQDTGTIYGLVDPRTNDVRYIGQTVKPIEVRLAGHLAAPAPRVRAWIEALAVEGRLPTIVPIREQVPIALLDEAEREEIKAHAGRGELLNTAGNEPGNARRRKISKEEAKRRKAEEEEMNRRWQQAMWRQVADQVRVATGGPIPPTDIPVRDIHPSVWDAYLAYHEADRYLTDTRATRLLNPEAFFGSAAGSAAQSPEVELAFSRRSSAQAALERYIRAYCGAFSAVDDRDRWGSREGVFGRGEGAHRHSFRDREHMARYLSFIPWAARALDPWVVLAEEAGMDTRESEFVEWVSDDLETRNAVDLYRRISPGWLGVPRQRWDQSHATYMLALGAAHIPGFITPEMLASALKDSLTELARERQATRQMCEILQRVNPAALDAVYGRDELAESDRALMLRPGTSAKVIRQIYGGDSGDPSDRAAKLLQRHSGTFDTVAIPDYSGWSGPHIPAVRVVAASFYGAGLLAEAEPADGDALIEGVKATWKPSRRGLADLDELEAGLRSAADPCADAQL